MKQEVKAQGINERHRRKHTSACTHDIQEHALTRISEGGGRGFDGSLEGERTDGSKHAGSSVRMFSTVKHNTVLYLFPYVRKHLSNSCVKPQQFCDALMCCIRSSRQFITGFCLFVKLSEQPTLP